MASIGGDWSDFYPETKKVANLFLKSFKKEDERVEIYFVDNATMASINGRFRKKHGPTNILSFSWPKEMPNIPGFKRNPLGEIYIAPDYIRNEKSDWRYLLIHGLLHILGFDHTRKNDKIEMEREEKKCQKIFS